MVTGHSNEGNSSAEVPSFTVCLVHDWMTPKEAAGYISLYEAKLREYQLWAPMILCFSFLFTQMGSYHMLYFIPNF